MGTSEAIRVAVIFGPGEALRPVWFDRSKRKHTIDAITCSWKSRQGETVILNFSALVGNDLYQLSYDTLRQTWHLSAYDLP